MTQSYLKKIASYSMVGSIGALVVASLQGCSEDTNAPVVAEKPRAETVVQAANAEQSVFLVLKQTGANPDTYELVEKYPSSSGKTTAIVRDLQGNERLINEDELKKIAEEEAKRVESGQSNLTQPIATSQGLSFGEVILASAAGALVGGMIANRLMSNANYRQQAQSQATRAQSTMSAPRNPGASTNSTRPTAGNSSSTTNRTTTPPRSGYFGGSGSSSSSSSSGSSIGKSSGG